MMKKMGSGSGVQCSDLGFLILSNRQGQSQIKTLFMPSKRER